MCTLDPPVYAPTLVHTDLLKYRHSKRQHLPSTLKTLSIDRHSFLSGLVFKKLISQLTMGAQVSSSSV